MADIVHLIRHGQSTFNLAWEETGVDPMIIDAPLTPHGQQQAQDLRPTIAGLGIEAVLVSPLTRAIQTASSITHGLNVPIHVDATHRELVWSSCDIGRTPGLLALDFPHLKFDHLPETWWWCPSGNPTKVDREPPVLVRQRIDRFLDAVRARSERVVAVVGHCTFFWLLTGTLMKNCEVLSISPHSHVVPPLPEFPDEF